MINHFISQRESAFFSVFPHSIFETWNTEFFIAITVKTKSYQEDVSSAQSH